MKEDAVICLSNWPWVSTARLLRPVGTSTMSHQDPLLPCQLPLSGPNLCFRHSAPGARAEPAPQSVTVSTAKWQQTAASSLWGSWAELRRWKKRQWLSAGLTENTKVQDRTNWEKPGWRHLLQTRPLGACQRSPPTLTCHRTALKSSPSSPWASTVGKGLISHLCLLFYFFQYCSCTTGAKNIPTTQCFFPKGCLPSLVANSSRKGWHQLQQKSPELLSYHWDMLPDMHHPSHVHQKLSNELVGRWQSILPN